MQDFFAFLSNCLWGWPMVILLFGTHIYLTVLLKFPQRKIGTAIRLSVSKDTGSKGEISPFGALSTALASTIGTGNIIGVATAVALGGPGAVLWCWLTGVLGMSTKYAEGLLSVKYREHKADGTVVGGPMYVLDKGLKMKWLGVLFALFTAVAAFGIGNTVQSNSIATLLHESYGISVYLTGAAVALLVGLVLLGGIKSIARLCSFFVPFMAAFYVLGCLLVLWFNRQYLGETFGVIWNAAFSAQAAGAGFVGSTVMMAARYGIARGLFSNESGMGSAPIYAAAAKTKNPVRQALVSSTGTFWDTVVICALTGLVIVSSILVFPDIDHSNGASLTMAAFSKIPMGKFILNMGLLTFTLSTLIGWSYCGEKAIEYLFGPRSILFYRITWVFAAFGGACVNLYLLWNIADTMNALMAIPNLISILLLTKVLVKETNKYLWNNRLDEFEAEEPNNGPDQKLSKE